MSTTREMRPFEGTMPLEEARALIEQAIVPIERTERIPVLDANGRVLARDVAADADVPPFSRAAMDGYAVRAADTTGATKQSPVVLRCIEQTFTGQVSTQSVGHGQCIEVATGAPLPAGADAGRAQTSAAARWCFAPERSSTPAAPARCPRSD